MYKDDINDSGCRAVEDLYAIVVFLPEMIDVDRVRWGYSSLSCIR